MADTDNTKPEDSHESGKRTAGKDYFEHTGRDVYTGPVTIHQHPNGQKRKPGPDPRDRRPSMPPTKIIPVLKRFFLVLASQVPVLGVAVTWWTGVLKKPLVAAGLMIGYEVLVLFWTRLGKPVWEAVWNQVWEEDLKLRISYAIAEWLRTSLLNLFSGFRSRYRQQVIYDHRVFPIRGLVTPGQSALEVEQVFVELRIAPSHHLQVSTNPLKEKDLPGSQPVWIFLRRLKKKEAIALAILGPPGCGKTTLLKHLALNFALKKHRWYRLKAAIPILLFLREHVQAIVNEALPLAELAQRYFADPTRYPELKPPPHWFACQLRAGRGLVLLDGLDEVLDTTHRQQIVEWVERQIRTYPRCQFVLTARPQGYQDNPLSQAQVLEVLPFTPEQVALFVRNWYVAKKLIEHGRDDRGVRQEADREARDMLARLEERPHLQELTVNPLLLTMIANVHNYRAVLPEKRVDLYSEICDVFLGHWQEAKGIAGRLNARQKRLILQPLAESMMVQHTREFSTQDTIDVITPPLLQVGSTEKDVPLFMEEVSQATCGLLGEQDPGRWGFAHFTFQEYLCATHWDKTGKAAGWKPVRWQELVGESWWHETLRLYAAQTDADTLVQACLELKTDAALQLAQEIEYEALALQPATRASIMKALEGRVAIRLRSEPLIVSQDEFLTVFKLNEDWRPLEYIQNDYEAQGDVVIDHATGLVWQKSGSKAPLTYENALEYVQELNQEKFAGYNDWRLPTIPELMSLLEPEKQSHDLYIHPMFDATQFWCWSADRLPESEGGSSDAAWYVHFYLGHVNWLLVKRDDYVRCVRSRQ